MSNFANWMADLLGGRGSLIFLDTSEYEIEIVGNYAGFLPLLFMF